MTQLQKLSTLASDNQYPLLTKDEVSELWQLAHQKFFSEDLYVDFSDSADVFYQETLMAVEALLCQAIRGNCCIDTLPHPSFCPIGRSRSAEVVQQLSRRVVTLNSYVLR